MKDLSEKEISKALEVFHTNGYIFMEREFPTGKRFKFFVSF